MLSVEFSKITNKDQTLQANKMHVELELVRMHYPYTDADIFAQ